MKIAEIWRYPVKSMLGEKLATADVGPGGIAGDRHWAVVDASTGVSLSAKRYPILLQCYARTIGDDVVVTLPDGEEYQAGSTKLAKALSELLERQVITQSADAIETIQHEFPTAVTEGEGDPFLYETPTEAFFDCAPLQLLTISTLMEYQRLLPESDITRARFRPNFLVQTDESGFVEQGWVHKKLQLGALECEVYDDTRRCIMVSHQQKGLPRDMKIIKTALGENKGCAGVALRTSNSQQVSRGDAIEVINS